MITARAFSCLQLQLVHKCNLCRQFETRISYSNLVLTATFSRRRALGPMLQSVGLFAYRSLWRLIEYTYLEPLGAGEVQRLCIEIECVQIEEMIPVAFLHAWDEQFGLQQSLYQSPNSNHSWSLSLIQTSAFAS